MKTMCRESRGSPIDFLFDEVAENEQMVFNARIINAAKLLSSDTGHSVTTVKDLLLMEKLYPDSFYHFFGPQTRIDLRNACKNAGILISTDFQIPLWLNLFLLNNTPKQILYS